MAFDDYIVTHYFNSNNTFNQKCVSENVSQSEKINQRLNGFDASQSEVMKVLNFQFSTGVTHRELLSIARIICTMTQLKLDRLATRDRRVLIKWFDENWYSISMIIPKIQLLDNNELPINLDREIIEKFKSKK